MRQTTSLISVSALLVLISAACSDPSSRPAFAGKTKQQPASADSAIDKDKNKPDAYDSNDSEDVGEDTNSQPDSPTPTPQPTSPAPEDDKEELPPEVVIPKPMPDPVMPDACKSFTWESVKSPEDALCFKSIDEVIASIPERVRSNFILIRNTRSAQPASLAKPRVVITSPDGSFIVAAATDQEKSKDIEIAVYDYKKNVWDFAGIDYSQTPPKVERMLCKSCHGLEPHPIWTEYPNWPSAYAGVTQKLTNEETVIMNEIASKKSTLPFVKHLVTRSSYRAGSILYPAYKYSGSENNQTLNIVIAIRAARSAVSKLYERGVAETELLKIAGEQMCGSRANTIGKHGLDLNKELNHGLEGTDRQRVIWSGNALGSYFVGIEILNQAFKRNPMIGSKLPTVAGMVNRPEFQLYRTESLKEFFAAEDALKASWQRVDNNFFRGTFKSTFQSGSAACKELGL